MTNCLKALPLCLVAIVACSASPPSAAEEAALTERTTVLDAQAARDVSVQADRLVFPAATHASLLTKRAGDVLVGDRSADQSASNRWGFLRKVKSVAQEGDRIVVMTEAASLTDAVREGKLTGTLHTPPLGAAGPLGARGIQPLGIGNGEAITLLDYSGTKLFDVGGSVNVGSAGRSIGYRAHATVTKGTLAFTPSWDVGADIHPDLSNLAGSVKEFHVVATGQLDADVELDVGLRLDGDMNGDDLALLIAQRVLKSETTTIADYPIDLGHLSLGPLSIPVHAQFKATLGCDVGYAASGLGIAVGGKASAAITAGFKYENGGMSPVFGHAESFEMVGPVWTMDAAVRVRCSVKPEFALSFFDLAAAEIWAEPYVSLGAEATCNAEKLTGTVAGEAQTGVTAAAHAKVDVLGLYQWEKACTLFDVQSPPAQVSGTFALPGGGAKCVTTAKGDDLPAPAKPEACFGSESGSGSGSGSGGGSGSGSGSGSGGGSGSGTCPPKGDLPPADWTCDAAKYGDCACDCACGAADMDCAPGQCGTCTHDTCTLGTALGSTCKTDGQDGACIAAICANDSYCCEFNWSASCVAHITNGDFGCTKRSCP